MRHSGELAYEVFVRCLILAACVLGLSLVAAGCYDPQVKSGGFACSVNDPDPCPTGFQCVNGLCVDGNGNVGGNGGAGGSVGGNGGGDLAISRGDLASSTGNHDFGGHAGDMAGKPGADLATQPADLAQPPMCKQSGDFCSKNSDCCSNDCIWDILFSFCG